VAFTIASCNKDDASAPSLNLQSETAVLSDDCTFADTVVRVYRKFGSTSSVYTNWDTVDFNLDGMVPLRLEGVYGSFFRPQEASFDNWYIGRLDSTTVCNPWLDLTIDVKNASGNL